MSKSVSLTKPSRGSVSILTTAVRAAETWVGRAIVRLVCNHFKIIAEQSSVCLDLWTSVTTTALLERNKVAQALLLHLLELNGSGFVES